MGGGGVEEKKAKERRNRIWEPFPLSPVPLLFLGDFPCGVVSGVVLRSTESGSEESERFHFLPTRSPHAYVPLFPKFPGRHFYFVKACLHAYARHQN